jgi:hypothetical protein
LQHGVAGFVSISAEAQGRLVSGTYAAVNSIVFKGGVAARVGLLLFQTAAGDFRNKGTNKLQ